MKSSSQRSLILFALTVVVALVSGCDRQASTKGEARFHCPMHPTYTSDRMGDCPICNMKLVPIKKSEPPATSHASDKGDEVRGRIAISIAPEKQHLIGVRYEKVERRDLARVIRATAAFEHDETRLAEVAPRFGGWVRKVHANSTGLFVGEGEPLLEVYSPEVVAAENEYLVAWRRLKESRSGDPQRAAAQSLLDSARRRLELWEISAADIEALEKRGSPGESAMLRAPISGHIVVKQAVPGRAFEAGATLYEIDDLSRLWLRALILESELPLVQIGQRARVRLPQLGDLSIDSTIAFIYPHIDPATRRAAVRIELDNPDHRLRPDMWAQVEIEASYGEVLAVPASAVIDTGTRRIAFVRRPDDHLEPREIEIGARTDDFIEVRSGLEGGDEVVARALFLVDSESQLKAAIAGMTAANGHSH